MNIQYTNTSRIELEMENDGNCILTAYDSSGNIFQLCNIQRKYLVQLRIDLKNILEGI